MLRLMLIGVALAHFDSLLPYNLILWTDDSVPFPFRIGSSAVLANCGTEATFSFSAGPVCSSFSAEAFAILQAFCWSRQHQQVCHFSSLFLLSDCHSASPPYPFLHLSFHLKLCGRSGRNCLLSHSALSGYNGSADTRFSWETTQLMSWPDGEHYSHPLLSFVSFLNSSTHRLPRFLPRNLCSLVMLAVFSLVHAAMDTVYC